MVIHIANPKFLEAIEKAGGISDLAALTGIPNRTLYWRAQEKGFVTFEQAEKIAAHFGWGNDAIVALQERPTI